MTPTIFSKQFFIGLCFSVGLVLLLSAMPAPKPAVMPVSLTHADNPLAVRQVFSGDDEFNALQQELQAELDEMPRYDQPDEAMKFYMEQRLPPGETELPIEKYAQARQQMARMARYSTSQDQLLPSLQAMNGTDLTTAQLGSWEALGPGNIGGRTRAILIDPGNPDTIYAAGVSGGVWKTTDAGSSWNPLDDLMANLAVASMAMDPGDSSVIYAGTGEGFFNFDAVRGDGIFKTDDAGATWTQLANTASNTDFHFVNDLVVSPNNSQRVYAATRSGVWRSNNGGTSWSQVYAQGSRLGCTDLAIRPDDIILAACGGTFSEESGEIRRSANGDLGSWTQVKTGTNMGRTSLAIAPSNSNVIYAASASIDNNSQYRDGLHAVFRSADGGVTWNTQVANTDATLINTMLFSNPLFAVCFNQFFNQGWYDNVIAVDPIDPNIVWVGGIDLFRSDDAGQSWGLTSVWWANITESRYAHADHHAIVFHPDYNGTTNQVMYSGNDGGVFRTDNTRAATTTDACNPNPGVVWNNLNNGYAVTQFYHGLPYPNGTTYFGGTQDNGTNRGSDGAGADGWSQVFGGDGGYVAIDRSNPNTIFLETTGLSIRKSTDGGTSFASATTGIDTNVDTGFLFINPFIMDPSNSDILWTGGFFLWRTTNQATSWTQASAVTPGIGSVSAWAVAPTDSNYVLAGMSDGFILRNQSALSTGAGDTWLNIQPADGSVSWLTFDPANKNIAYATYSTFGVNHVWKSTNAGATWTPIDNGIPDIPAHTVAVDPLDSNRIFVGTDLGVFVTTDGGANWAVENDGLANVVVETLYFNNEAGNRVLYAFTHGRGVYRITTFTFVPTDFTYLPIVLEAQ